MTVHQRFRKSLDPRTVSVELHLRDKRKADTLVCLSACLSVVSARNEQLMGGISAIIHRNLRVGRDKNPGSTNKYTKFGQLIIRKNH